MSRVLNVNHTDSAVSGVSSLSLPISVLNYAVDWGVKDGTPNEVILVNNTSPIDRMEKIRIAVSDIANIYNGTNIDPNLFMDTKRGVSLLSQLTGVYTITDNAIPEYERVAPISAHLVLKFPTDAVITASTLLTLVGRLCSTLLDTGVTTSDRLGRMVRGSLRPSDL